MVRILLLPQMVLSANGLGFLIFTQKMRVRIPSGLQMLASTSGLGRNTFNVVSRKALAGSNPVASTNKGGVATTGL